MGNELTLAVAYDDVRVVVGVLSGCVDDEHALISPLDLARKCTSHPVS